MRALTEDVFRAAVARLAAVDPDLGGVISTHGAPPFWHREPGFPALVLFILEQQVSLASARAAYDRLVERVGVPAPAAVLELDDATLREVGFSRQKTRYVRALASAIAGRRLDLDRIGRADDDEARRMLMAIVGIGRWTADVYLLSCLRRPDIWPVGDRALQVAAAEIKRLPEIPSPERLEEIGEVWRPHRASAARILWHGYLSERGR